MDRREPKFFLHYMVSLKLQYFTYIVIEKNKTKTLWNTTDLTSQVLGCVAQSVGHLTHKSEVLGSIPGLATYFCFAFR